MLKGAAHSDSTLLLFFNIFRNGLAKLGISFGHLNYLAGLVQETMLGMTVKDHFIRGIAHLIAYS